ncbi:hypothetical protein M501DRAFT_924325 [Patellaria atrata CBS 101060]|uniref:Pentatricopeptide repeat-containing protein n=1 Tax=Patellaria atrata CBS 101060 TaxID=1346257 RepID=A0A9P4SKY2_9PEZI|nr:hypothetical protein M501DRAFT_924325 [Patellaria atrata CBS 101060]
MRQTSKNNNPSHHSNSIVQDRSNQNPQSGNRSIRIHRLPQKTPFRSPQQRVTNPESIEKQLGRALEQQDIRLIDRAWQQAQALYASSGNVSIPIDLYNLLIYTLSSMKRLEDAFSVLQFMKLNGILPTLITWTSLMKGCTKTHNPVLLEKVWAAMLAVNIQPDDVAWTIRIQGLLNSDRINEGLQCLNDMTTAWATALLSKAKGSGKDQIASIDFKSEESVPGFPKPTTGTLNAVITVLARKGKLNRFTEVFQWAKTYGILFDVITYNILIKSAIRRNQTHIAIEYLRTMEAENVKPDVITFTLVLDAVFRRRGGVSLSTEEQDSAITAILSDMDRHGLQPNVHSFATMIDGLLKHHNNLEAAQGILKHMECKGIHPSAHIYTSLIAYYFSQEPPDVNAVDALWNGIQTSNAAVDLIFYDRMVEGYAKADRAGSALNLLRIMARDGKTPGWVALTEVAKTLAYNEQWERLQELVSDVELEEGLAKHGVMGQGAGRAEHFWALVENYGIERRKKGLPSQRRTVRKEMEI